MATPCGSSANLRRTNLEPCTSTPYRWACQRCQTLYYLSETRRCLECGDRFGFRQHTVTWHDCHADWSITEVILRYSEDRFLTRELFYVDSGRRVVLEFKTGKKTVREPRVDGSFTEKVFWRTEDGRLVQDTEEQRDTVVENPLLRTPSRRAAVDRSQRWRAVVTCHADGSLTQETFCRSANGSFVKVAPDRNLDEAGTGAVSGREADGSHT